MVVSGARSTTAEVPASTCSSVESNRGGGTSLGLISTAEVSTTTDPVAVVDRHVERGLTAGVTTGR